MADNEKMKDIEKLRKIEDILYILLSMSPIVLWLTIQHGTHIHKHCPSIPSDIDKLPLYLKQIGPG